jgi:hypothetical protein
MRKNSDMKRGDALLDDSKQEVGINAAFMRFIDLVMLLNYVHGRAS